MKKSNVVFGIGGILIGVIGTFATSLVVVKRIAGEPGESMNKFLNRYRDKMLYDE